MNPLSSSNDPSWLYCAAATHFPLIIGVNYQASTMSLSVLLVHEEPQISLGFQFIKSMTLFP